MYFKLLFILIFQTGIDKQKFQRKIVNFFLGINFNIWFLVLKRTVSLRRFF